MAGTRIALFVLVAASGLIVGCASSTDDVALTSDRLGYSSFASRVLVSVGEKDVPSLVQRWPVVERLPQTFSHYELVHLHEPPLECDGYVYSLLVDGDHSEFWVMVSGGSQGMQSIEGLLRSVRAASWFVPASRSRVTCNDRPRSDTPACRCLTSRSTRRAARERRASAVV